MCDLGPPQYAECAAVLRRGFGTVTEAFGITAENTPTNPAFWTESDVAAVVAKGFTLFGTAGDGHLLGCAFVGPTSDPTRWSLRHLAVAPEARHRGIGAGLVQEAARRARAGGAHVLRIGIVAENLQLADWYHRLGFVTVAAGQRFPGLVFSVDHLELALSTP